MTTWLKFGLFVLFGALTARYFLQRTKKFIAQHSPEVAVEQKLREHSKIFDEARIVKVTDGVHVAIGFALGNMIMIEGRYGVIVVDTTENRNVALNIFKEYQTIVNKPLKAIILTHFHGDHILGAKALVDQAEGKVEVFMHSTTEFELRRYAATKDENIRRVVRQFGVKLRKGSDHVNSGIGPSLKIGGVYEFAKATHTFDKHATHTVAGITFELLHTPGETDDQISVWIPEKKLLMPADNVYEAFPNLYAIRGSPSRNTEKWFRSLDDVRALGAEYMVPSHTRPVIGAQKIYDIITHYRDAIQYVHDQTIRLTNKGFRLDEVVENVRLPTKLANHHWLQEFYGTVSWSVRGVYNHYFGWFDGDPVNLNQLARSERANQWLELLSPDQPKGTSALDRILSSAQTSLNKSDDRYQAKGVFLVNELQWALELSTIALDWSAANRQHRLNEVKQVKYDALRALGASSKNANARNYYMSCASELDDGAPPAGKNKLQVANTMNSNMDTIMKLGTTRLDADACDESIVVNLVFVFTDLTTWYRYILRHCVFEYTQGSDVAKLPDSFDVMLTMTSRVWKEIVTQQKLAMVAYEDGEIQLNGSLTDFKSFLAVFEMGA